MVLFMFTPELSQNVTRSARKMAILPCKMAKQDMVFGGQKITASIEVNELIDKPKMLQKFRLSRKL